MIDRRLDSFQKLALTTTAVTYLLILVGGLVRAVGAGLGCPDWPKCFGSWVPPVRADQLPPGFDPARFNAALTWTEYLNRLLGVTVGFLIFATLALAFTRHRRTPRVLWPTLAAFLLVGYQGWLGGQVVAHGLRPWIVTAHLVVALVIVNLLLYATVSAFFPAGAGRASPERRLVGRAAYALIAITLAQVALGTQVRGRIDDAAATGTLSREALLSSVGSIDLAHREASLVVLAGGLVLFFVIRRRHAVPALVACAGAVAGFAAAQVAVGVVLAYGGLPRSGQVAHLALASLLLGAESLVAMLAYRLPDARASDALTAPPGAHREAGARG
jgi:heme a synthase